MSHRCDLAVTNGCHHDLVIRNYTPHPISLSSSDAAFDGPGDFDDARQAAEAHFERLTDQIKAAPIDVAAVIRVIFAHDPTPPRCGTCGASLFGGRCILNAACPEHSPRALTSAEREAMSPPKEAGDEAGDEAADEAGDEALSPDERRRLRLAPHAAVRIVPSTRHGADAVDVYADGVYVGFLVREMEVSHG